MNFRSLDFGFHWRSENPSFLLPEQTFDARWGKFQDGRRGIIVEVLGRNFAVCPEFMKTCDMFSSRSLLAATFVFTHTCKVRV